MLDYIDDYVAHLFLMHVSASSKRVYYFEDSAKNYQVFCRTHDQRLAHLRGEELHWSIATVSSDGIPLFRKGMGNEINGELSTHTQILFNDVPLFDSQVGLWDT